MLLTIGVLFTLTAGIIATRLHAPRGLHGAPLGWMSEQWLAEHRASHLP
jgi:hypothetical protein